MAFDAKITDDILGADLRDMTGTTVTDPHAVRAGLADVRATGLAESVEEAVLGECELAAVLTDRMGGPIGAVGVVATAEQWPLDPSVSSMLRDVARNTSRELGASSWPPAVQDDRATDKDAWRRRSRTG